MGQDQQEQPETIVTPLIVIGRSEKGALGIDLCGNNPAAMVVLLHQTLQNMVNGFRFDAAPAQKVQPVSSLGLPDLHSLPPHLQRR